ncbi:hypothetical protein GC197_03160 [bacterium]|nr:hypothetical protein [bacterium]
MPILSLTVGMVALYLVAGLIGMPIAFQLCNRNALNFYTIHRAALGWGVFLGCTIGTLLFVFGSPRPTTQGLFMTSVTATGILSPFILLSATAFWWLVKQDVHKFTLRTMFVATTIVAIIAGLVVWCFQV